MKLILGDCLEKLKEVSTGSVSMILTDLPYGTTVCAWDSIIPFNKLWEQYERVIKDNGAIVLFGAQPFTSALIMSNPELFRYSLVWDKVNKYTGALNANRMPLRRHEDILVFYKKLPTYNKQYREGKPFKSTNTKGHGEHTQYGTKKEVRHTINTGKHNPCSIIEIPADIKTELGFHPTQKVLGILEYLIKTYSNEGETVLDSCMGSGSTGVACKNLNREFIGIERDELYFNIAKQRIGE